MEKNSSIFCDVCSEVLALIIFNIIFILLWGLFLMSEYKSYFPKIF